jgi:hypothetical protein
MLTGASSIGGELVGAGGVVATSPGVGAMSASGFDGGELGGCDVGGVPQAATSNPRKTALCMRKRQRVLTRTSTLGCVIVAIMEPNLRV